MSVDEEVNLDEVIDRIMPIMTDVATVDTKVRVSREGALGVLDSDRATPLIMVITELVQNAIEHAFDEGAQGQVVIRAERSARWLDVVVHDDGRGLPEDSAWRPRIDWDCRLSGRWCRPRSMDRWTCVAIPRAEQTRYCGFPWADAPG